MNLLHSCLFLLDSQMELSDRLLLLPDGILYKRITNIVLQNWIAIAKLYIQRELTDVHNESLFTEISVKLSFITQISY
jgi:hypothetical protein